jgi:drug/metabolite transporter (DMT)-like permease
MLYLSPCLFGLPLFFFAGPGGGAELAGGGGAGILFLIGAGLLAFLAQALMALGYRGVQAGKGSVVFYLETVLTVILGLLFANETFNARCVAGLALISGGLILNQLRPGQRSAAASD